MENFDLLQMANLNAKDNRLPKDIITLIEKYLDLEYFEYNFKDLINPESIKIVKDDINYVLIIKVDYHSCEHLHIDDKGEIWCRYDNRLFNSLNWTKKCFWDKKWRKDYMFSGFRSRYRVDINKRIELENYCRDNFIIEKKNIYYITDDYKGSPISSDELTNMQGPGGNFDTFMLNLLIAPIILSNGQLQYPSNYQPRNIWKELPLEK